MSGNRLLLLLSLAFLSLLFSHLPVEAERGGQNLSTRNTLRVCTQNLNRYGLKVAPGKASSSQQKQIGYLTERMSRARCDIIAVQEIVGRDREQASLNLARLAARLSKLRGWEFSFYVGKSYQSSLWNGFLLSKQVGEVSNLLYSSRKGLPKLQPLGPSRYFSRGLLGIQIRLSGECDKEASNATLRELFLLTLHFKSKAGAWKDLSGSQFEAVRMEMAAGLRREVDLWTQTFSDEVLLMVLGDRNSDAGSASASILNGTRRLEDFSQTKACSLDPQLRPDCPGLKAGRADWLGLLEYQQKDLPSSRRRGTYRYRKREYLLDEILVSPETLAFFLRSDGSLAVGLEGDFVHGSDHKLLWAEIGRCGRVRRVQESGK